MVASRSGHWTTITRSQVSGGTVVARWGLSPPGRPRSLRLAPRALPDVDQAAAAHVHAVHDVLGDRGNVRPGRREALAHLVSELVTAVLPGPYVIRRSQSGQHRPAPLAENVIGGISGHASHF